MKESVSFHHVSVKGHKNVRLWTSSQSLSVCLWLCPICTMIDISKYILCIIMSGSGARPLSGVSKYCGNTYLSLLPAIG
jgi:hypothetical protein